MNYRTVISEELSSISPAVANIPFSNVFSVPEKYFDTLSSHVLASISANPVSVFEGLENKTLAVPEGYFDGLADAILSKIKTLEVESVSAEISRLSKTISGVGNKNIFTVPFNYFENTIIQLQARIPKPARIVEMKRRSSFLNYAAAAVVSGIIGLSVLSVFNNKPDSHLDLVPRAAMAQAGEIIKNNSFDRELNTVSDNDIQLYLEQHGQDVNAALVASATDDNNLPNPGDYLSDDKTLDEYLNKINLIN
ncbi:MAG: hypothetical protein ABIT07_02790 [Ferruginibacter sp.]